jgi:hypothetical protein
MNQTEAQFNKLLEAACVDPNILAFWLGGSRGKGMVGRFPRPICDRGLTHYSICLDRVLRPAYDSYVLTC